MSLFFFFSLSVITVHLESCKWTVLHMDVNTVVRWCISGPVRLTFSSLLLKGALFLTSMQSSSKNSAKQAYACSLGSLAWEFNCLPSNHFRTGLELTDWIVRCSWCYWHSERTGCSSCPKIFGARRSCSCQPMSRAWGSFFYSRNQVTSVLINEKALLLHKAKSTNRD